MRIFKLSCVAFFLLFMSYLISRVFLLDVSQNDLSLVANPDIKGTSSRPPVYLISYADGEEIHFRNQNALALSALGRGFDYILNYKRSLLAPSFLEENKIIMDTPHGKGLWLWKPYLILKTMKEAPDGAIIIYADTSFIFQKEISVLLEKLNDQDMMIVQYSSSADGTVQERIQRKTLELMNVSSDSDLLDKNLMWAGFSIFRNSKTSRDFVEKWFDHARDPQKLMNYSDASHPEHPNFRGHHYDQSILTLLAYQEKDKILFLSDKDLFTYVVWHHRSNREHINDRSAFDKLHFYLRPIYGLFSSTLRLIRGVLKNERSVGDLLSQPFVLFYYDTLSAINRLKK